MRHWEWSPPRPRCRSLAGRVAVLALMQAAIGEAKGTDITADAKTAHPTVADTPTSRAAMGSRGDCPEHHDDANWLTNVFSTHGDGKLVQSKKWINEEAGWAEAPGDVRIMPWG